MKATLIKIFLIFLPSFLMGIHLAIAIVNSFIWPFPKEAMDVLQITGVTSGIYGFVMGGYFMFRSKKTKNLSEIYNKKPPYLHNQYNNSNFFNFYKNSPRIK